MNLPEGLSPCTTLFIECLLREDESNDAGVSTSKQDSKQDLVEELHPALALCG